MTDQKTRLTAQLAKVEGWNVEKMAAVERLEVLADAEPAGSLVHRTLVEATQSLRSDLKGNQRWAEDLRNLIDRTEDAS